MNYVSETEDSEVYMHEYEHGWDHGDGDWWDDGTAHYAGYDEKSMVVWPRRLVWLRVPRARPKLPPPLHLLMKGNFVKLSGQNRWQNPSPWKPNGLGQGLSPASPASPGVARDCPGRGAGYGGKGKFKGKSKYGYATEMDAYYAKGKSKSKGKGKSKKGMYLNADAVWKGKGKGPDWGSCSVNAYAVSTDYFTAWSFRPPWTWHRLSQVRQDLNGG